jgi:hypothetical protein
MDLDFPNLIHFNINKELSSRFILPGQNYIFELPESKTIIYARCGFKAVRAADMKILYCIEDGKKNDNYNDHWFAFEYENYDSIYFTSYKKAEYCKIYRFRL